MTGHQPIITVTIPYSGATPDLGDLSYRIKTAVDEGYDDLTVTKVEAVNGTRITNPDRDEITATITYTGKKPDMKAMMASTIDATMDRLEADLYADGVDFSPGSAECVGGVRMQVVWARPDDDIATVIAQSDAGSRVAHYLADVERALDEARAELEAATAAPTIEDLDGDEPKSAATPYEVGDVLVHRFNADSDKGSLVVIDSVGDDGYYRVHGTQNPVAGYSGGSWGAQHNELLRPTSAEHHMHAALVKACRSRDRAKAALDKAEADVEAILHVRELMGGDTK